MKFLQKSLLIALCVVTVLTATGLVLTSDWGSREVPLGAKHAVAQPPVDTHQMQTAMSLAPLAAAPEEQDLARTAMRDADHEVDFAFASALYQAAAQKSPSTPEIREIQERISNAEAASAAIDGQIDRLNKSMSAATESQKLALGEQLDLAKARQELNDDELDDAHEDLARAGGDPKSRIQHMVEEHNSAAQDSKGQLDLSIVGRQAIATQPASNSLSSRARAFYALRSLSRQLSTAQQDAYTQAAAFSKRHDDLEHQLEKAKSEQTQSGLTDTKSSSGGTPTPNAAGLTHDQNTAAISSVRTLAIMQRRLSSMDSRIRNQQDLAGIYGQWASLAGSRERSQLHGILVLVGWMLLVGLVVWIADYFLEKTFARLEPDQRNLLTLRAVAHIATRAVGAIAILLLIFGAPTQTATILALAGAGLTVALKDFIVGFFGWFVLMGKNGIRHGDWVEINGVSGEVVEIGLFHTVLLETGNWNDVGHPTGRRVTFVNSYAIEGHYFNFSTSGQWLWDELQVVLPVDQDPYPIVAEIQKIVAKETEGNSKLAEEEWNRVGSVRGSRDLSAGPAISIRPANPGFEILIRYVTRANLRYQQRSRLYTELVDLLRRKNIPEPIASAPVSTPARP